MSDYEYSDSDVGYPEAIILIVALVMLACVFGAAVMLLAWSMMTGTVF